MSIITELTLTSIDINPYNDKLPFLYPLLRKVERKFGKSPEFSTVLLDPSTISFIYVINGIRYTWQTDSKTAIGIWGRYYFKYNTWSETDTIYVTLTEKIPEIESLPIRQNLMEFWHPQRQTYQPDYISW